MANPQLEDGFVRVANEIMDRIVRAGFNGVESAIVWGLIRRSYGFNRKEVELSIKQFEEITGRSRGAISKAVSSLKNKNILIEVKPPDPRKNSPGTWMLNKDWESWTCFQMETGRFQEETGGRSQMETGPVSNSEQDPFPNGNTYKDKEFKDKSKDTLHTHSGEDQFRRQPADSSDGVCDDDLFDLPRHAWEDSEEDPTQITLQAARDHCQLEVNLQTAERWADSLVRSIPAGEEFEPFCRQFFKAIKARCRGSPHGYIHTILKNGGAKALIDETDTLTPEEKRLEIRKRIEKAAKELEMQEVRR